ncbi:hypothetical protein LBAT_0912 [Lactobacillus acetotolerans]|uniref:Uncharacterized protein n=2 Tax=Lactobacillus acetotolerans TaxID=1600 RepID=A0A0D6A3I9_9LACO|nr:hypothetical protein [Lactobacillus acetotolerans]BAQ57301.1 hypothetical protein LBAT_0912 [Lactobacillus acetotolerans]
MLNPKKKKTEVKDPFYGKANQAELNRRFKKVTNKQDIHLHHLLHDED